jgi:dimethylhistidine N-methyltransferase
VHESITQGLNAPSPTIAPKYFYDALGSRLFDAITDLPEYYPTRTEAAILTTHAKQIAELIGEGGCLVDLGAGNCEKATRLFSSLKPSAYVAVDISADYLKGVLMALQRQYPHIAMTGMAQDFSSSLSLPAAIGTAAKTMFYPGSSIGNFTPAEALKFLKQVHRESRDGKLLIGVDRVKPKPVLEAAYDDALGVTAAFNLNVLNHLNRLVGTNFEVSKWRHVALFNEAASRIEMHLESREAQQVNWKGGSRRFEKGERIHTENSYKYRPEQFEALLKQAGFHAITHFTDEQDWFSVFVAQALY